ncbi:DUF4406 domain-containing protein [Escherichia coli]
MKIYIAGPMTGYPDYNRTAFFSKAKELMEEGHIVLNPALLPAGLCQSEYMDICLAMVRSADAIYLLKGWDVSAGARAEHALAEKLGLTVIYEAPSDTDCRMAAHLYRELVDALRDVAIECHGTDQLRARLSNTLSSYLSLAEGYNLRQSDIELARQLHQCGVPRREIAEKLEMPLGMINQYVYFERRVYEV